MGKAINVKIARVKVIKALEVKLEEMHNAKMNYDLAFSKYEADIKEWKEKCAQIAFANFDITSSNKKSVLVRNWTQDPYLRVEVEVEIDRAKLPEEPKSPKDPFQNHGYGRNYIGGYDDRVADITNALRMLKMSDEEIVSTSTYQSVSRYL